MSKLLFFSGILTILYWHDCFRVSFVGLFNHKFEIDEFNMHMNIVLCVTLYHSGSATNPLCINLCFIVIALVL